MTLRKLYNHPDTLTRYIFRYSILVPVLVACFLVYPVNREFHTKGQFVPTIFAEDGTPLAYQSFNDCTRLDNIPLLQTDSNTLSLFNYLILREDADFYSPFYTGVSIRNIFPKNSGGSTLPQQFLKNAANPKFVTNNSKRTIISKLGEISAGFKLTRYYSSQQLLQLYANEVAWLKGAYGGVELNALRYFDIRNIVDLNPYERYLLGRSAVGVNAYGIDYRTLNRIQRDSMDTLVAQSFRSTLIQTNRATEEELNEMLSWPVRFRKTRFDLHNRPYIFDLIKPLPDSIKVDGAQYLTSLQTPAIDAVNQAFEKYAKQNRNILYKGNALLDANALVMDLHTGNIIGVNTKPLCNPRNAAIRMENHINILRPIASPIKVLMMAEGLKHGLVHENDILIDEYRGRIHNYNNTYHGSVTLTTTIQKSLNTPLDNHPHRNQLIDYLESDLAAIFGNTLSPLPAKCNMSQYCLGQPRMLSIPQMAMLFRAMIMDGVVHNARITRTILSTDHYPFDTIYRWQPQSLRFIPENTCRYLRELLKAPLTPGGTLHHLFSKLNHPDDFLGKSGTSDSYSTGWTILANSKYLVVVSINYYHLNRSQTRSKIPIPTKSGSGSAGVIATYILNELN